MGGDGAPSFPRGDGRRRSPALALVLAMVGVFGILAYSVQQRVRDFGVRRALGATTGDVLRLVVGERGARGRGRRGDRPGAVRRARPAASRRCCSACSRWISLTFAFVAVVLGVTAALSIAGPGVARRADRSGGRAAGEVSRLKRDLQQGQEIRRLF